MATFNLAGANLTAPLTTEQEAAIVAAVKATLGNMTGVGNINIGSVKVPMQPPLIKSESQQQPCPPEVVSWSIPDSAQSVQHAPFMRDLMLNARQYVARPAVTCLHANAPDPRASKLSSPCRT